MRYDELVEEINQIKEEMEAEKSSQRSSKIGDKTGSLKRKFYDSQVAENLEGDAYFLLICDNFNAYRNYLMKKN